MALSRILSYIGFVLFLSHTVATWLQDQISRLNQENGSLKQNLTSTNAALKESRLDLSRASNNNAIKVDRFCFLLVSAVYFASCSYTHCFLMQLTI